jgi:ATP-dependent Lon protease
MILDELDKAEAGADQSIPDVLLNLLEPRTARSFTDEALDWPVDASNMLWITMANDLRKVSDPLLSRFSVIEVREPTREEMIDAIIPEIYSEILDEYGLIGRFGEEINQDVCRALSQNPRTARKRIIQALSRAAETGKTKLDLADLGETGKTIVRRIGFGKGGG